MSFLRRLFQRGPRPATSILWSKRERMVREQIMATLILYALCSLVVVLGMNCRAAVPRESRASEVIRPEVERVVRDLKRDPSPSAAEAADLIRRLQRELTLAEERAEQITRARAALSKELRSCTENAGKWQGLRNGLIVGALILVLLATFVAYRRFASRGLL